MRGRIWRSVIRRAFNAVIGRKPDPTSSRSIPSCGRGGAAFRGDQDQSGGLYTKAFHTIWQQNREFNGRVAFDPQLSNLTTGAVTTRRGTIVLPSATSLPVFTLTDIADV